jgi:hypothetical protein
MKGMRWRRRASNQSRRAAKAAVLGVFQKMEKSVCTT